MTERMDDIAQVGPEHEEEPSVQSTFERFAAARVEFKAIFERKHLIFGNEADESEKAAIAVLDRYIYDEDHASVFERLGTLPPDDDESVPEINFRKFVTFAELTNLADNLVETVLRMKEEDGTIPRQKPTSDTWQ